MRENERGWKSDWRLFPCMCFRPSAREPARERDRAGRAMGWGVSGWNDGGPV